MASVAAGQPGIAAGNESASSLASLPLPVWAPLARVEAERLSRLLKAVADPTRLQHALVPGALDSLREQLRWAPLVPVS
jgi:hypothetical protein